jgi:hypothetical protein
MNDKCFEGCERTLEELKSFFFNTLYICLCCPNFLGSFSSILSVYLRRLTLLMIFRLIIKIHTYINIVTIVLS